MSKFSLASLLRLRKLDEDQRAAELNSSRSRQQIGLARTRRVRSALADSTVDPVSFASLSSIAASRASAARMLAELDEVDRVAGVEVSMAAAAHAEAHRRTQGLEKLEQRFDDATAVAERREEQLHLDDLSARAWSAARKGARS